MLFANDVLIDKRLEEVYNRLEKRRASFEGDGLRINRSKTEYMEYDFGVRKQEVSRDRLVVCIYTVRMWIKLSGLSVYDL